MTPSWSPWRSCRPCWGLPPRPAGCGTPVLTCGTCSRTCPSSPVTISGCAEPPRCSGTLSGRWRPAPPHGPMTSGWWTPPRSSAAGPVRPPSARTWPDGLSTGFAPATPATSGAFACIWYAPCRACPSPSPWPAPRPTSARSWPACSPPARTWSRPGQTLIGDKNYFGAAFEATIAGAGITLLRPARKGEPARAGAHLFRPLRQIIEPVNETFKGQLDLEQHGGHTPGGVIVRVLQRILALTTAIWHNDTTGQPVPRSLVAFDH